MKTLALAFTMLFSLAAQATSIQHSYRAELDYLNFDSNSSLAKLDVRAAFVEVNFVQDYLMIELMLPWRCPPNALCAMVMPMRGFQVENFVESVDACGSIVYEATKDDRPVDGSYEKITVIDNRSNYCPTFRMLEPTRVEYEVKYFDRINGKAVRHFHVFHGRELK